MSFEKPARFFTAFPFRSIMVRSDSTRTKGLVMNYRYRVLEVVGAKLDEEATYRITRHPMMPGSPHFECCAHAHTTIEEAAQCREFEAAHLSAAA
jgi:hypothetical protein